MKRWCIHTRRKEDGRIIKVQMPGPDDGERMLRIVNNAIIERGQDHLFEVIMLHEESEPAEVAFVMPMFPTAIENMIYQGMAVVGALTFAAHFIIHKQKEQDS